MDVSAAAAATKETAVLKEAGKRADNLDKANKAGKADNLDKEKSPPFQNTVSPGAAAQNLSSSKLPAYGKNGFQKPKPGQKESKKEGPAHRKHYWNFSHGFRIGGRTGSRGAFIHAAEWEWRRSKKLSLNVFSAFRAPMFGKFVNDKSLYGLSDTGFSIAPGAVPLPKMFFAQKWAGKLGLTLPTSTTARRQGKLFSVFGSISHILKESKIRSINYSVRASHTLYLNLARWNKDRSGHRANSLSEAAHAVQGVLRFKRVSFSAKGQIFFRPSLRNKGRLSFWQRLNWRNGEQGFQIAGVYKHPKPKIQLFLKISNTISFISPVLTGFQLLNPKYTYHLLGIGWEI